MRDRPLELVRGLGIWPSTAIAAGTMIGTGIFLVPTELACGEIRGKIIIERRGGLGHNSLPGLVTYPIMGDGLGIARF